MSLARSLSSRRVVAATIFLALATVASACGFETTISSSGRPALNYNFASSEPLRVAIIDETGGSDWTPAINSALETYRLATPHLAFRTSESGANIVIHVRRYNDAQPPEMSGYTFAQGMGGFAAVYDADGYACNFPPSDLPLGCSGEIARADIYLNDIIPAGPDIESRRLRLVLHELGHAFGLERHAPDLEVAQLAQRYGWE